MIWQKHPTYLEHAVQGFTESVFHASRESLERIERVGFRASASAQTTLRSCPTSHLLDFTR